MGEATGIRQATLAGCSVLIVGCGDIGIPLGQKLADSGAAVWGLRRSSTTFPAAITAVRADVTRPETLSAISLLTFDYVVVTLTPASYDDDGYRRVYVEGLENLLTVLVPMQSLKQVLFVSSTSVYAQSDGQWVDENSETTPDSFSGQRLLQAEQVLARSGVPYSIVRFAGIYGPGRRRLIEQVLAGKGCDKEPAIYTNRIHRDDCVGFLAHLIHRHCDGVALEKLYIGVDSEPVSMWEIKCWLAEQLHIDPATMKPAKTPRRNSKRCCNRRLLDSGYTLLYPGYRQGYGELLRR